jgi:hypothetical protein
VGFLVDLALDLEEKNIDKFNSTRAHTHVVFCFLLWLCRDSGALSSAISLKEERGSDLKVRQQLL